MSIHAARVLHADLCAQRSLVPVAPPADLPIQPGEWTLGVIPYTRTVSLRYCPAQVVYSTGPAVVVGTPHFLTGYALGSLVNGARLRRKARDLAQPQWPLNAPGLHRGHQPASLVPRQPPLGLLRPHRHHRLRPPRPRYGPVLTSTVPLKITGPWTPWIAVATAHLRYDTPTAARISALNTL